MKIPPAAGAAVRVFERSVPDDAEVTRRPLFGNPAAFVRGQLFYGVFGEDLFLRLAPADRAKLRELAGVRPFEPMPGRPMTEYLVLPPKIREDPRALGTWIGRSLRWARALPPKGAGKARGRRPKAPVSGSGRSTRLRRSAPRKPSR